MSDEVAGVLRQVRSLESEGEVETSLGDIWFTATASDLDRDGLFLDFADSNVTNTSITYMYARWLDRRGRRRNWKLDE